MSILITGGTGFLGRGLVRRLLQVGHQRICVYSRGEYAQAVMQSITFAADAEKLRFFVGDVRDIGRLERAMQGVDFVIHAAALKRIEVGHYNPDEMVKTNILGTMNVLEAARRARVRRLVLVSSDKAYQPVSPYGYSKAMAESLFLAANSMTLGARHVVCRYGNVAGSTGSVIPRWRELIAQRRPVPMTDPNCTRFWMTIDQAVELVLSALETDKDLLIPELPAYRLQDLATAMDAPGMLAGILSPWEKQHESMGPGASSDKARRLLVTEIIELLREVE